MSSLRKSSEATASLFCTILPDGNSDAVPPDSIPNSEVKRVSGDGSVGFPHVRVAHRQAPNSKEASKPTHMSGLCCIYGQKLAAPSHGKPNPLVSMFSRGQCKSSNKQQVHVACFQLGHPRQSVQSFRGDVKSPLMLQ